MGTFLYEYATNPIFEKEIELKTRLREVLLDCGECGLSEVCINNRKIYLMSLNELSVPLEDGFIELSYNRYERDWWECSYVNFEEEIFHGVRSRAIGSKIGWAQHYRAMLIARVLCECYSNGTYMVYGDVSNTGIIYALAYIGKKYELELVQRFIKNRCDLNNFNAIETEGEFKEGFWGIRDGSFYYREFLAAKSLSDWNYDKNDYDDLKKAEMGENIDYYKSQYYLGIQLLYHMLEQDLKDIDNIDEHMLHNIFLKYCAGRNIDEYELYLENLPDNIKKYKEFYYKNLNMVKFILENIDMICKCISLSLPEKISIIDTAKKSFIQYYSEVSNLSEDELNIYISIYSQAERYKIHPNEEIENNIFEKVKSIINKGDHLKIDCFSKEKDYLNELYSFTRGVPEFSNILISKIESIFSGEVYSQIKKNWEFKERTNKEIFDILFDIAEKIYEENRIHMNEDFFYKMIEAAKNKELSFRLDLLWHLLNQLDGDDKFIATWVIEIDYLYEKYALNI